MGSRIINRIIPMRTFNYYRHGDEDINLLQACYENPLFDEDGTVLNDSRRKVPGQVDGIRSKGLEVNSVQTSVHYSPHDSSKWKALKVFAVIVAVLAIIGIIVGIIVGQRQTKQPERRPPPVLFSTKKVEGSFKIIQGPFSIYKPEFRDKSSTSFSIFSSSFTYQMDSIFTNSDYQSSYSHTELVNISSGSVIVHFTIHFHQDVHITRETKHRLADILNEGFIGTLYVIDSQSVRLTPKEPAISVITTSTPGVCIPIHMTHCVNVTSWSLTTFPNILGHTNPKQALVEANKYSDLFFGTCAKDFWCTIWNPKCHHNRALPPCRSYCRAVFSKCKITYETDVTSLLNCEDFPDSENPDVCSRDPFPSQPEQCVPYKENICQQYGHDHVAVPGYAGFRHPAQASSLLQIIAGVNMATHCYKHSVLFGCAALLPNCSDNGRGVIRKTPPCRSLCENFKARCEIFMDIFWDPWPEDLHCSEFPDDPSSCIGYYEAHEPPEKLDCKIGEEKCDNNSVIPLTWKCDDYQDYCKIGEEKCDNNSCIPLTWKCDDYQDCKDGKDEMPIDTYLPLQRCAVCPAGMIRCSPRSTVCIDKSRRCDGIKDCPVPSDEEDCVRIGDGGRSGTLTVYNPMSDSWDPVCADGWNVQVHSKQICTQLLYKELVGTSSTLTTDNKAFLLSNQRASSEQSLIQSFLTRSGHCSSQRIVSITCDVPECGIRPAYTPEFVRIVGGDIADPNAWPWHVSLHGGKDMKFFCGGSIIAERWILTAGHCIGGYYHRSTPSDLLIKVGQPRRDTYSPYLENHHAEKLYLHPEYDRNVVNNDIALIQLKEPIHFNDHVRPVCLPKTPDRLPVGTRCTAIGWGKRNETALYYERQMKQVYLEVVNQTSCNISILGAERKVPYQLNENMFCAGGGLGHDACSGDSGGPLLCQRNILNDTWFAAGIVSWGVGCAYPNVPGVYTNLPVYLPWIRNVTGISYLYYDNQSN